MSLAAQLLPPSVPRAALSRSIVRTAVKSFQEAEASFQTIKRLLPERWVSLGTARATMAHRSMPDLLRFIAEPGRPQQHTSASAQHNDDAEILALLQIHELARTRCTGCGDVAQGLRKCGRCRQVGYCR